MNRVVVAVTAVVVATALALGAGPARADGDGDAKLSDAQKLAIYSKPAVVRIIGAYVGHVSFDSHIYDVATGGLGTGFFLSPDGYIATNAHVVSTIHDGDDKAKDALLKNAVDQITKAYQSQLSRLTQSQQNAAYRQILSEMQLVDHHKLAYVVLPNGQQLQYDIKAYGAPVGEGKDCAVIKVVTENAPTLPIGDSTKVQVQDHLFVIGYPGVADLSGVLDEKSQLEASVTSGTVSAIKRTADGEQVIQTDAAIAHGNSGGPAIDEKGEVIGLATFGDAQEVQGFHFLVSSQMVMEFVRQAGTKLDDSISNALWRDGLALFWDGEYTDAIAKFQELVETYPAHSAASSYITQARAAIRDGKEKKPSSNGGLVGGLVALGILVAIGAVFLVMRSKPRPPGHQPMQTGPGAHPAMQPMHPMQTGPGGYPAVQPMQTGPGGSYSPMATAQPMHTAPTYPAQPGVMMAGGNAPQPIAKTMAIQPPMAIAGQVAPTAFAVTSLGGLTCTRGPLAGQRFALTHTGIIIGRQPGVAHIVVNDHRASGKHVWIGFDNGKLVAIDQGTTNGTYVNDVARGRISRAELRDGDVVIVGEPDCCSLQVKLSA
jgi:S1-C subfamily serine protease